MPCKVTIYHGKQPMKLAGYLKTVATSEAGPAFNMAVLTIEVPIPAQNFGYIVSALREMKKATVVTMVASLGV